MRKTVCKAVLLFGVSLMVCGGPVTARAEIKLLNAGKSVALTQEP